MGFRFVASDYCLNLADAKTRFLRRDRPTDSTLDRRRPYSWQPFWSHQAVQQRKICSRTLANVSPGCCWTSVLWMPPRRQGMKTGLSPCGFGTTLRTDPCTKPSSVRSSRAVSEHDAPRAPCTMPVRRHHHDNSDSRMAGSGYRRAPKSLVTTRVPDGIDSNVGASPTPRVWRPHRPQPQLPGPAHTGWKQRFRSPSPPQLHFTQSTPLQTPATSIPLAACRPLARR
jgi:hypothetical protein